MQLIVLQNRTLFFTHSLCDSLRLLTPTSHSNPPLDPPPWQPQVCSLCPWSLFVFHRWFICVIFQIPHICDIIWYLSLSFWFILLSMIISRSIHVAATGMISFIFMAKQYSIVFLCHIAFIHSSVDGHLDCFHILIIVNSAAMNCTSSKRKKFF